MPLDEYNESARPYRCGIVLLCMGALINWLGFAQNYEHPVRYIGIACIVAGVLLIVGAVCCWAKNAPTETIMNENESQQVNINPMLDGQKSELKYIVQKSILQGFN